MKMSTERWLRINTCWSDSEWLYEHTPGVRLAWIELLCYVKRDGVRGRAKAISVPVASNKWRIPKEDVVTLLSVSQQDGALQVDGGDWVITNWIKYQGESNERVKRFREKKEAKKTETSTETETLTGEVTHVTSVTLHNVTKERDVSNETSLSVTPTKKPKRKPRAGKELTPITEFAHIRAEKWVNRILDRWPGMTAITVEKQERYVQDMLDYGYTEAEVLAAIGFVAMSSDKWIIESFQSISHFMARPKPSSPFHDNYHNWMDWVLAKLSENKAS